MGGADWPGTYHANGSGRDTYISKDPRVYTGISEPTPRQQTVNGPGLTPRPPSSLARGSKAAGYTGFLPGRKEAVGKGYAEMSEQKNMKNRIPKLRLKHRYVSAPDDNYGGVTSREYGAYFTPREPSARVDPPKNTRGSQSARPALPPLIHANPPKPTPRSDEYWQQHKMPVPISPRKTQRTTMQDTDLAYKVTDGDAMPKTGRHVVGMSNIPQGYTGYKPRFRFCYERE